MTDDTNDTAKFKNSGMTAGEGVTVTVETEGVEEDAEMVHMHIIDEAAKAMQAFEHGKHPDKCDGQIMSVDWDSVFSDE